jgi:hypothetical protein
MKQSTEKMRELLRLVMVTDPVEIDCDSFLSRVGAFLEARERGDEMSPEFRTVCRHLEVCAECKEELEALLKAHAVSF